MVGLADIESGESVHDHIPTGQRQILAHRVQGIGVPEAADQSAVVSGIDPTGIGFVDIDRREDIEF